MDFALPGLSMNGLAKGVIGQVSADAVLVVGVAIDELKPRMHLEPYTNM